MTHSKTARRELGNRRPLDMKLEVVVIPVSDADAPSSFYGGLGWRLDADFVVGDTFRGVQFTPPGSPASIHFGTGITPAAPGSASGLYPRRVGHRGGARRAHRPRRRSERSVPPRRSRQAGGQRPASGAAAATPPSPRSRIRTATSGCCRKSPPGSPAGSTPTRRHTLPRRDLAAALRRAAVAHGEHEKRNGGQRDENWPDWYAEYMVAEQAGKQLPL